MSGHAQLAQRSASILAAMANAMIPARDARELPHEIVGAPVPGIDGHDRARAVEHGQAKSQQRLP